MLDRHQLETFATIIECGSFDGAAAVLSVTRGAISQRIRALEESLSTVLLIREKPVRPTPSGEALLRHVKALRLLEMAALAEMFPTNGGAAPASLAIAVNADSLATWFPQVLWQLLERKGIAFEVVADDQDHTLDRLVRGEVIGCISADSRPAQGFVAEPLGLMEYRCYSTPEFANRYFDQGISTAAVTLAPAISFNRKDGLHHQFLRTVFGFTIDRFVRHYLPSPEILFESILAGWGYGLIPRIQAATAVASGALVDLAPSFPMFVALYWHHWSLEPPQAKVVTELIVGSARRLLAPAVA